MCFIFQFGEATVVAGSSKAGMAPFLAIEGTLEDPVDFSVIAENEVIVKGTSGLIDAIEAMLFTYYVCNIQYPKECFNSLFFLQRAALKVFDTQKVPTKVLVLLSEISKL